MDISSILSSLSDEDIEKLKNTASQFFGASDEVEEKINKDSKIPLDAGLLNNVAKFSKMMNENDDRCNFIYALKPLLSSKRQKKADDAVMMLRFMKIMNALQEKNHE